ncbi:hypothetical protein G210_3581 [Candida maltosa Xu316]|uniref:Chromo domain-containing protein n=1 Tax=Candida maltosa (strain Xu316) TaxID=1245528 RepID=M3HG16_CANMX|nr:hypothetical protein G210_3581 [Candida maltosa Xu316]
MSFNDPPYQINKILTHKKKKGEVWFQIKYVSGSTEWVPQPILRHLIPANYSNYVSKHPDIKSS